MVNIDEIKKLFEYSFFETFFMPVKRYKLKKLLRDEKSILYEKISYFESGKDDYSDLLKYIFNEKEDYIPFILKNLVNCRKTQEMLRTAVKESLSKRSSPDILKKIIRHPYFNYDLLAGDGKFLDNLYNLSFYSKYNELFDEIINNIYNKKIIMKEKANWQDYHSMMYIIRYNDESSEKIINKIFKIKNFYKKWDDYKFKEEFESRLEENLKDLNLSNKKIGTIFKNAFSEIINEKYMTSMLISSKLFINDKMKDYDIVKSNQELWLEIHNNTNYNTDKFFEKILSNFEYIKTFNINFYYRKNYINEKINYLPEDIEYIKDDKYHIKNKSLAGHHLIQELIKNYSSFSKNYPLIQFVNCISWMKETFKVNDKIDISKDNIFSLYDIPFYNKLIESDIVTINKDISYTFNIPGKADMWSIYENGIKKINNVLFKVEDNLKNKDLKNDLIKYIKSISNKFNNKQITENLFSSLLSLNFSEKDGLTNFDEINSFYKEVNGKNIEEDMIFRSIIEKSFAEIMIMNAHSYQKLERNNIQYFPSIKESDKLNVIKNLSNYTWLYIQYGFNFEKIKNDIIEVKKNEIKIQEEHELLTKEIKENYKKSDIKELPKRRL